jgi:hypothetical protein
VWYCCKHLIQPHSHTCRFLYDDHGSQLYEQITGLPEYYPYRTEKALLTQHAAAIAARLPRGAVVVELGCGDCTKTSILLKALLQRERSQASEGSSVADEGECIGSRHGNGHCNGASVGSSDRLVFCGVDCSGEMLRQTQRALARLLPELPDQQVGRLVQQGFSRTHLSLPAWPRHRALGFFSSPASPLKSPTASPSKLWLNSLDPHSAAPLPLQLPPSPISSLSPQQVELYEAEYLAGVAAVRRRHPNAPLAILWLGSSVGNFSAPEAAAFLGKLRAAAGPRAQLLLCTDRWKDARVLRAAYNDSQGGQAAVWWMEHGVAPSSARSCVLFVPAHVMAVKLARALERLQGRGSAWSAQSQHAWLSFARFYVLCRTFRCLGLMKNYCRCTLRPPCCCAGVSEAFIINGMHHALCTLGHPDAYRQGLFQYEVEVHPVLKQVPRAAAAGPCASVCPRSSQRAPTQSRLA